MSRILIIGSEGQLGSELSSFFSKIMDPSNIFLSDIKDESSSILTYNKLDALSYNELKTFVKSYRISHIYHLAAILSAKGETNPMKTWNLNMNSLLNVLELGKNKLIDKIFWPSSISVFGINSEKVNTRQNSVKDPTTVYGISKLAGERWCEYYNMVYNVDVRSVRFPGIISSNTLPGGGTTDYAVEIFHSFIKNEDFKCFLSENTMLPMIYIDDAIESIWKLMNSDKQNLTIKSSYNISAFSISPKIIFDELKKINSDFKIIYSPDKRQSIADSWPDTVEDSQARKDWNWKEKFSLKQTIKEMLRKLN
ncbi:MAG: NAD-dependent epimerase [Cytophagia bacterium]|nr:NAD-dependent epimerase [Cytophagia bacterium]